MRENRIHPPSVKIRHRKGNIALRAAGSMVANVDIPAVARAVIAALAALRVVGS
jgi:hypothetical protein